MATPKQSKQPAYTPGIIFRQFYRNGDVLAKDIYLFLHDDALLRVIVNRNDPSMLSFKYRNGNDYFRLNLHYRYKVIQQFQIVRYHTSGKGPISQAPDLTDPLERGRISFSQIERLAAQCYAQLRDEAARIDRKRGFLPGYTTNRLAAKWAHGDTNNAWLKRHEPTPEGSTEKK